MYEARKKEILERLGTDGHVRVQDLSARLQVSLMTIRRDLATLEQEGLLIRTHGGAVSSEATENLFSFANRLQQKQPEKGYICSIAAGYIASYDTVFVDCGTTLYRLTDFLQSKKNLRVISNSLPLASELMTCPNVEVSLIGGNLDRDRKAIYGIVAEKNFEEYRADKAFIGADGISLATGLTSYDEREARITRLMAENARTVYLLCDSSKLEQDSYVRFANLSLFDYLITDHGCSEAVIEKYTSHGVKILQEPSGHDT